MGGKARILEIIIGVLIILLTGISGCRAASNGEKTDFASARKRMVERQIKVRGISDKRILEAFTRVERHAFVDSSLYSEAYNDYPLPIGEGQTISQPYIVALMTELLDLKQDDKVLEIGTGSGYQAAILGELVDSVFTIEIVEPLGVKARNLLKRLGYENIFVKIGDGYRGWPEHSPFDAVIVTCAPEKIPQPLIDQLSDGGRMIIPVGDYWQELVLIKKHGEKITRENIAPVRFVPMTGESEKDR
jgi:protein-L-isoaspartate(D-aspartate) O-methyltransferase